MTATAMLRVSAVSTAVARVENFKVFANRIRTQVAAASAAGSELLVFPEYLTSALIGIDPRWERWSEPYEGLMREVSREFQLAVLGTHLHLLDGALVNRGQIFMPDGRCAHQDKVHLTPWEQQLHLRAGSGVTVIDFAATRLAILICYDVEFPMLAHAAAEAGAEVLLVPSWTDDRHGFNRVRFCAHARAIEHQVFVVHAPLTGGDPTLPEFESACGKPGILSPCDGAFPEGGLLADGPWQEQVVSAQLDLGRLRQLHASGTVTPRRDARLPLDCQVQRVVDLR